MTKTSSSSAAYQPKAKAALKSKKAQANLAGALIEKLRLAAKEHIKGNTSEPCALVWPDKGGHWAAVVDKIQADCGELYILGDYCPEKRKGPAMWLRAVEARTVPDSPKKGLPPIFYLPGIGHDDLKDLINLQRELTPILDLLFRGSPWVHPGTGRDWLPDAFLRDATHGFGLMVESNEKTIEALSRTLPSLVDLSLEVLTKERIDERYLNGLLSGDTESEIIRWMNDPAAWKKQKTKEEREAFRQECQRQYRFDPDKSSALAAAELMCQREGPWELVWSRFEDSAVNYPELVQIVMKVTPQEGMMFGQSDSYWKLQVEANESLLGELKNVSKNEVHAATEEIQKLSEKHGKRADSIWGRLDRLKIVEAIQSLAEMAQRCLSPLAAGTLEDLAKLYIEEGWKTDWLALEAVKDGQEPKYQESVQLAVHNIYGHWLDQSARNLQKLLEKSGKVPRSSWSSATVEAGTVVLFADGLRMDLAKKLQEKMADQLEGQLEYDWSALPTITSTAKPALTPIADSLVGGDEAEEYQVVFQEKRQVWSQDRFVKALEQKEFQFLKPREVGDPQGRAWTEIGTIDKDGHDDGWRLALRIDEELEHIQGRIQSLIEAGWSQVIVVTDHGWLWDPKELPKVELPKYLVANRRGRCAWMKSQNESDLPQSKWYWNEEARVCYPFGAACFKAGLNYAHGGLSIQETVVPRLTFRAMARRGTGGILSIKWVGLRCQVVVSEGMAGREMDIRRQDADASSSMVEGRKPRVVSEKGGCSLPVEDTSWEGKEAVVVLLSSQGDVLARQVTKIGG